MEEKHRKSWRLPIIIGLVLLGGVVLGLVQRSRSQGELRRYMAELRAKGEKLTFAELSVGPPPAATNSTTAFNQATARLKVGVLAPYLVGAREFVRPGEARVRWREALPAPDASTYPPPPLRAGSPPIATWAQLRDQFESNKVALAQIKEAMRNPTLDSGMMPSPGGLTGYNFVGLRQAAQWLSAATILDLHDGNTNEALADLEALGGMAHLNCQDYVLVAQMIRVAVSSLGLATTWELLQNPDLTEAQLQRVAAIWQDVDFLEGLERALVGERAFGNQFWTKIQNSSAAQTRSLLNPGSKTKQPLEAIFHDFVALPAYRLTSMESDQLFYLHCMQGTLDAARAVRRDQAWLKSKPALDATVAKVSQVANTPQRLKYWMTLIAMPNVTKASETVVKTETERRLTLAAIALQRYRLQFGKYPEKLESLVPEFLRSLPIDCMNGKPLSYHLNPDGSFTLYSIGSDGRDDGGDPSTSQKKANLTLWSGNDAVWPRAVNDP